MSNTVPPRARRWAGVLLILALVALAVLRSHVGTRLDGYTVDEPWHIVAGASYLRTGDFRLNPEHPPLIKLAAGLAVPAEFKLRPLTPLVEKSQERDLVEDTMYLDNHATPMQPRARAAMWTFHAVLLALLGFALWQAFGLAWAAGTLAFLAIEPSIGAHLPVVMTDLPLALSFGLAAVCAGLLASSWRWRWVAATGLAVGLALGSKHSALAGIAGIAAVLAAAAIAGVRAGGLRTVARRGAMLAIAAVVALAVLWGQYGFRFHAGPDGSDAFNRAMADKVGDLNIPHWRDGIGLADQYKLLPRAYLWGLADTVRAGVEGRGQSMHRIWGTTHKGRAPWFTWPSILAAKVPIALMALALLGLVVAARTRLSPTAKWALAALLGGSAAHLLALMGSQGTYGGIRHALPLVVLLAILAGAAVHWGWQRRTRLPLALVALLFVLASAMTLPEPRLWEYHNELAGGTANAFREFGNEGLDLGQRYPEIRAFHDRVIKPEGSVFYSDYWFVEEQAIADRLNYRRRIGGMDDDNVAGLYEGYFLVGSSSLLPQPDWGWDPDTAFKDTVVAAQLGYLQIRKGRMSDPMGRAGSMYQRVVEYLYQQHGKDDALAARRLEEVVLVLPPHVGAGVELGNAYLRLGDAAAARAAYQRLLDQKKAPIEALVRAQLQAQVGRIDAGADPTTIKPVRNPWME